MGDLYFNKGIWDSARSEYREAKRLCHAIAYLRCYAEAVNNAGLTALSLADLDEAQSELMAARQSWKSLDQPLMEAITTSNLGLLFWETGEWQLALNEDDMARKLFEQRDPLSEARTLNNIGLVYMSMTDYDRASNYFLKALRITLSRNDAMPVRGRVRINLGRARMLSGQLESAARDLRVAVFLMRRIGDISGLADALNNLGQVQLRLSRLQEAMDDLNKAFLLYQEIKDQSGLSSVLHHLGILAAREHNLDGSEQPSERPKNPARPRAKRRCSGDSLPARCRRAQEWAKRGITPAYSKGNQVSGDAPDQCERRTFSHLIFRGETSVFRVLH